MNLCSLLISTFTLTLFTNAAMAEPLIYPVQISPLAEVHRYNKEKCDFAPNNHIFQDNFAGQRYHLYDENCTRLEALEEACKPFLYFCHKDGIDVPQQSKTTGVFYFNEDCSSDLFKGKYFTPFKRGTCSSN